MTDVVIVGGGIVGTSVAYQLRDEPVSVTLVEKDELGAATTAASMALVHRHQLRPTEFDQRLRRRSWEVYDRLIKSGVTPFTRCGLLYVAETAPFGELLERGVEALRAIGVEAHARGADELAQYGIRPGAVDGAMHTPDEGYLETDAVVAYFANEAREAGATVLTGTEVTDLLLDDGIVGLETTAGVLDADVVVNAAGPWAADLNEMAGLSLPLRHTRGPILELDGVPDRPDPVLVFERGSYVRQGGENGAYVGALATDFDRATRLDPDATGPIGEAFRETVDELASTLVPSLDGGEVVDEYVGLRTVTPDGRPLVGATAVEGFLVACGMNGLGVTLAPAVGQLLASSIGAGTPNGLLEPLDPHRFEQ